jgi:hypothetical protein
MFLSFLICIFAFLFCLSVCFPVPLIDRGQLRLHVFDEGRFLGVGLILHFLRGVLRFCLDLLDLLRGGLLFVAYY